MAEKSTESWQQKYVMILLDDKRHDLIGSQAAQAPAVWWSSCAITLSKQ